VSKQREGARRRRPDPYGRDAAISWHFERDPIPYALETDWPLGHIGVEVRRETGKE
jgi:hypothetical protein